METEGVVVGQPAIQPSEWAARVDAAHSATQANPNWGGTDDSKMWEA